MMSWLKKLSTLWSLLNKGLIYVSSAEHRIHKMSRLIDTKIEKYLKFFGAVCVVGPRRGGTTRTSPYHCNNAIYIGNPAGNFQNLQLATLSPELVPDGDIPRLVDNGRKFPKSGMLCVTVWIRLLIKDSSS